MRSAYFLVFFASTIEAATTAAQTLATNAPVTTTEDPTDIPVVNGGTTYPHGNETWQAKCDDMASFMAVDDECDEHRQHDVFWTLEEAMIIDIAFVLGSTLSLIGSGFIMVTFITMPSVRTFSFQIVFCLCLCDFFSSAAGLAGLHFGHIDPMNPSPRCYVTAVILHFCDIGTFCWVCIVAVNIWLTLAKKQNTSNLFVKYHITAWGISALLTIFPAIIDSNGIGPSYGYAGGGNWCWLRDDEWLPRVSFFYVWLIVAIIIVSVLFGLASRAMQESEMDQSIQRAFICKLKLYVVIFSFVRLLGFVDTVARAINPCCPLFYITVVMSFIAPMLGVANASIFGFSKMVRAAYREKCCKEKRKAAYQVEQDPPADEDPPPSPKKEVTCSIATPEKIAV